MEQISAAFSYHKKYLSAAFKKQFKVGVWEYLNIVRLNHAFALMENGHTSVQTIASLCGFNDALYFSRYSNSEWAFPHGNICANALI